jgi:ubiquinone/menaquinone biosynthesis C-methylase UbiE
MLSDVRRRLPLGQRTSVLELLDSGRLSLRETEANLADLARMNRLLPGGTDASARAIEHLLRDAEGKGNGGRIVDVGTGAGDMPLAFARRGWETVAVDANPHVLSVARRATAGEPRVTVTPASAAALPFGDSEFDVAHCSLLLHHLAPTEAVAALRELRRVSRRGVVVNDLRRGFLPIAATAVAVVALGRSRVTRSDGVASARSAYTLPELDRLLADAGLSVRWRSAAWMPRVVTAASA